MGSLISNMKAAGLGRAMRDARNKTHAQCTERHSTMLSRQEYQFCPHCGVKLEVKKFCETCKKSFLSLKAYDTHLQSHTKNLPPKCICHACGERLEHIFGPRYRCLEDGTIFDWVYARHTDGRDGGEKRAVVVYKGIKQ